MGLGERCQLRGRWRMWGAGGKDGFVGGECLLVRRVLAAAPGTGTHAAQVWCFRSRDIGDGVKWYRLYERTVEHAPPEDIFGRHGAQVVQDTRRNRRGRHGFILCVQDQAAVIMKCFL